MNIKPDPLRFGGIERLYGQEAAADYRNARVCVVGIGGVGSWAAEALARTGIGRISLVDLDDICVTNTNRQIHALSTSIGQSKVAVMAERIGQINPACEVDVTEDFLAFDNIRALITCEFDLVIDAIDSFKAKAALVAHCKRNKIPLVCTGAAGGKIDPLQVCVTDLNKTYNDPVAAKTRSYLRRHFGFSRNTKRNYGISMVTSIEQLRYPDENGSVCHKKTLPEGEGGLDCNSGFGSVTMVTATFGFVAVTRGLQLIDNKRKRLAKEALAAQAKA